MTNPSKLAKFMAMRLATDIALRHPIHLDAQAALLRSVAHALLTRANAVERVALSSTGPEAA